MRITGLFSLFTLFLAPLLGSNRAAEWDTLVSDFIEATFAANPAFAVQQGRHDFDGRLPDWSEAGLAREVARLKAARARAESFESSTLDARRQFEREHLIAIVRRDLFWLTTADFPRTNPSFYADALDPDPYVSRDYAPLETRLAAYTRYATNVPTALAQIRHNLRGPLARPHLEIGRIAIGGLADFFAQDVPRVFAPALQGEAAAAFESANSAAINAVGEFSAWLDERARTATDDFSLGADRFRAMVLETEGVDLPLAQLEHIARSDLERNLAALEEACARFAPGKTTAEAVALAAAHKPTGSVVQVATDQLAELRAFVVARDLVTIPGLEEAKVAEAPAYKRWNFAYIMIPGPFERGLPSIYYVAPPDPAWPPEKRADYVPNIGSLLFTSVHEVWPGHFLQFLHANRVSSPLARVFVGYASAEGWAHYTEDLMWEAGLGAGSPELHIGQLQEALLRNVRFVAAIGLHTQGLSLAEAERLFREKGLQDPGNAEQQALRGTFDPAYINYTMGKLMIRKLRDDWCAARGGRAAWKQFHDEFLRYGGPPIPLVRRAMLGPDDHGALF